MQYHLKIWELLKRYLSRVYVHIVKIGEGRVRKEGRGIEREGGREREGKRERGREKVSR